MSAFASYASPINSPNQVLPPIHTTGTEGSTYLYGARGGRRSRRLRSLKNKRKLKNKTNRKRKSKNTIKKR